MNFICKKIYNGTICYGFEEFNQDRSLRKRNTRYEKEYVWLFFEANELSIEQREMQEKFDIKENTFSQNIDKSQ